MSFILLVVYPSHTADGEEVPIRQEAYGPWDSESDVRLAAGERGWVPSEHGSLYALMPLNESGSIAVIMPRDRLEGQRVLSHPHAIPHATPWAH